MAAPRFCPPICVRFEIVFGVSAWWEDDDDGECGVERLQLIVSRPAVFGDGERDVGGGCCVKSRLRQVLPLVTWLDCCCCCCWVLELDEELHIVKFVVVVVVEGIRVVVVVQG